MLHDIKQGRVGKALYRLSRTKLGLPLHWAAKLIAAVSGYAVHLKPEHRRHNRAQAQILAEFERRTGARL